MLYFQVKEHKYQINNKMCYVFFKFWTSVGTDFVKILFSLNVFTMKKIGEKN